MKRYGIYVAAALSVAAVGLSGCAVLDSGEPLTICPPTAILDDAGEIVRYTKTPPTGPGDLAYTTRMKYISGVCDVGEDEVVMELSTAMEATRGPANKTGEISFTYFVAILGKDKKILTRTKFPMIARFQKRETKLDFADAVTVTIPRKKGDMPKDYVVYLGFEMSPEELANNRKKMHHN